jgi:hypothetical protein
LFRLDRCRQCSIGLLTLWIILRFGQQFVEANHTHLRKPVLHPEELSVACKGRFSLFGDVAHDTSSADCIAQHWRDLLRQLRRRAHDAASHDHADAIGADDLMTAGA